jgi:phage antirepressor YoqD-like protein
MNYKKKTKKYLPKQTYLNQQLFDIKYYYII